MKKLGMILFVLFSSFTRQGDELEAINTLIHQTESQLQIQKDLKHQMEEFIQEQVAFMEQGQSKDLAEKMVQRGDRILRIIDENHYQHLFSLPYLEELKLFSKMAHKTSIEIPSLQKPPKQ